MVAAAVAFMAAVEEADSAAAVPEVVFAVARAAAASVVVAVSVEAVALEARVVVSPAAVFAEARRRVVTEWAAVLTAASADRAAWRGEAAALPAIASQVRLQTAHRIFIPQ